MDDEILSNIPDQFLAERIEAVLKQKDSRIGSLEMIIREKDFLISRCEHALEEKANQLSRCNDVLNEKQERILNLEDEIRLRILHLEELKSALARIRERDEHVENGGK